MDDTWQQERQDRVLKFLRVYPTDILLKIIMAVTSSYGSGKLRRYSHSVMSRQIHTTNGNHILVVSKIFHSVAVCAKAIPSQCLTEHE
jgi:hypothetical protein